MEVLSLFWSPGPEDLHLMRGRSPDLNLFDALNVSFKPNAASPATSTSLRDFRDSHDPNKVAEWTFKPTFKATEDTSTHDYKGFGVTVNRFTGLVQAGPTPDPSDPPLYNFIVRATLVANKNDAASPRRTAYLRIHLHYHVVKAWLSPSPLKIPKNISGFRFGLYAQFDDKTIAELERSAANSITWASVPVDKFDDAGEISFDNSDADGAVFNVAVQLTDVFRDENGLNVTAEGVAIPYTLPQVARLIPNSAGYDQRNEVPNFIFLAEGFQAGDQPRFNAMIDLFMRDLRQNDKFKPFDRLVGRMNFWKVFVPSAARGIGTKSEVYGEGNAQPVPMFVNDFEIRNDSPATENDLNDHAWGPNQVRFYFGLPVLPHKGMDNSQIKAYWKQISKLEATLIDTVSGGLVEEWKKLGDRRRVDESDTFLGMYLGLPPKAKAVPFEDTTLDKFTYQTHEHRFTRTVLNNFLLGLQYKDENDVLHPIGSVWDWSTDPVSHERRGKDYDNVVTLLCSNSGRALNTDGQLFTNVIDEERQYLGIEADAAVNATFANGRAVKMADLDGSRLPADLPLMSGKTVLLHEISHSLGLGDEYGERGIAIDSARLVFPGTGNMISDRHFSNVQAKSDLVHSPGVDRIDAAMVKWRWHRIEKCGVLAPLAPPDLAAITPSGKQPSGTPYTVRLKPGQAAVFKEHEVVFLRRRRLGESILTDIEYSEISLRYPFVTRSPRLRVLDVHAAASEVVVEPVDDGALTDHDLATDFPAECVLYKPLPARTVIHKFPPAGASLELTAENILSFIDRTGLPLHEKMDAQGDPDLDFEAEQSPDLGDITVALCAKKNRNIVGLYAGGETYHHGIYHATGHCIMRDGHQVAEFCSVCKYILTDYIDPALHPEVDALIEEYYPLEAYH